MRTFIQTFTGSIVSGFASYYIILGCFKTWTTEKTDTDWLTGEMALAHKIKDKSSATYQKGQLIDKRRRLMQKYSDYACATHQSKVVSIKG